jgi:hypothetical protein
MRTPSPETDSDPDQESRRMANRARRGFRGFRLFRQRDGRALALRLSVPTGFGHARTPEATEKYAAPADSVLPPSDMRLDLVRTALVVTDPIWRAHELPFHRKRSLDDGDRAWKARNSHLLSCREERTTFPIGDIENEHPTCDQRARG